MATSSLFTFCVTCGPFIQHARDFVNLLYYLPGLNGLLVVARREKFNDSANHNGTVFMEWTWAPIFYVNKTDESVTGVAIGWETDKKLLIEGRPLLESINSKLERGEAYKNNN